MSHSIKFSGPFIKALYTSSYNAGRLEGHPLYGVNFNDSIPNPIRRINCVIQNNETVPVTIGLSNYDTVMAGGAGIILNPNQTLSLDNFNGPIIVIGQVAQYGVTVTESFA